MHEMCGKNECGDSKKQKHWLRRRKREHNRFPPCPLITISPSVLPSLAIRRAASRRSCSKRQRASLAKATAALPRRSAVPARSASRYTHHAQLHHLSIFFHDMSHLFFTCACVRTRCTASMTRAASCTTSTCPAPIGSAVSHVDSQPVRRPFVLHPKEMQNES